MADVDEVAARIETSEGEPAVGREQREALETLAERLWPTAVRGSAEVRERRFAFVFAGASARTRTGLAALLARRLRLDLYRIDVAAVVSKWIGETEKNLDRLFAKAADNDWILFFDEADALFGKRTEVNDSHERYANQATSYLLGRLEEHSRIIVLGTAEPSPPSVLRRSNVYVISLEGGGDGDGADEKRG